MHKLVVLGNESFRSPKYLSQLYMDPKTQTTLGIATRNTGLGFSSDQCWLCLCKCLTAILARPKESVGVTLPLSEELDLEPYLRDLQSSPAYWPMATTPTALSGTIWIWTQISSLLHTEMMHPHGPNCWVAVCIPLLPFWRPFYTGWCRERILSLGTGPAAGKEPVGVTGLSGKPSSLCLRAHLVKLIAILGSLGEGEGVEVGPAGWVQGGPRS